MSPAWRVWLSMLRRPVAGGPAVACLHAGVLISLLAHQPRTQADAGSQGSVLRLRPAAAHVHDWRMLEGVGPVLAARLHEACHGRSRVTVADLDAVPGVGPIRIDRWRAYLALDTPR